MPTGVYKRTKPSYWLGRKRVYKNPEIRNAKISETMKGKKFLYRKRKPLSEETKKKIGLANSISLKGKKHSEATRARMKKSARRGELNNKWKGGITSINEKIRKSLRYKEWRISVFERDNYTCQICKKRGVRLQADHIKPFSLFPRLRFDLINGRTLCKPCHINTDTYGGKLRQKLT